MQITINVLVWQQWLVMLTTGDLQHAVFEDFVTSVVESTIEIADFPRFPI